MWLHKCHVCPTHVSYRMKAKFKFQKTLFSYICAVQASQYTLTKYLKVYMCEVEQHTQIILHMQKAKPRKIIPTISSTATAIGFFHLPRDFGPIRRVMNDNFSSESICIHVCKTNAKHCLCLLKVSVVLVFKCPAVSRKKAEIDGQRSGSAQEKYSS